MRSGRSASLSVATGRGGERRLDPNEYGNHGNHSNHRNDGKNNTDKNPLKKIVTSLIRLGTNVIQRQPLSRSL